MFDDFILPSGKIIIPPTLSAQTFVICVQEWSFKFPATIKFLGNSRTCVHLDKVKSPPTTKFSPIDFNVGQLYNHKERFTVRLFGILYMLHLFKFKNPTTIKFSGKFIGSLHKDKSRLPLYTVPFNFFISAYF